MTYRISNFVASLTVMICLVVPVFGQTDWPTYGHDGGSTHHSSLKQITPENVSKLARAWTYHMTPAGQAEAPSAGQRGGGGQKSEATPLIVDGLMYLPTPNNRVVALNPETGKEVWSYTINGANASTRGVEYWPGDGKAPASIF